MEANPTTVLTESGIRLSTDEVATVNIRKHDGPAVNIGRNAIVVVGTHYRLKDPGLADGTQELSCV